MRYLVIFIFALAFTACNSNTESASTETSDTVVNNNTSTNADDDSKPVVPGNENETGGSCYMQVLKRDTMVLHISNTSGENISGRLSFDNYEKDGSTGTVKGKREGDVLKLIYSFQSEGTNSVMEVYFKEENDGMVRGVGEMQTMGDTAYFVQPDKITYPSNGMMKKTNCNEVPEKYK
jgi:hypothetical protein